MPRIRQKADEYAMTDFINEINAQCGRFGYRSQKSLGAVIGVCQATAGNYLKNPDNIPLGVLRSMVKAIKPDPLVVLRAIGYSSKDIKDLSERRTT